jgi:hypothetical protein
MKYLPIPHFISLYLLHQHLCPDATLVPIGLEHSAHATGRSNQDN